MTAAEVLSFQTAADCCRLMESLTRRGEEDIVEVLQTLRDGAAGARIRPLGQKGVRSVA